MPTTTEDAISRQREFLLVGGSGFLGKQLARRLLSLGDRVVIATRQALQSTSLPADLSVIHFTEVTDHLPSADMVVILSVINNDRVAGASEIEAVNVELPVSVAREMADRTGKLLVTFGSAHAEDPRRIDPYSISKRQLTERLATVQGVRALHFILPPVYGDQFVRKLEVLDRLPGFIRSPLIVLIGAIKPLIHVNVIAAHLRKELGTNAREQGFLIRHIADDQSSNPIYRSVVRTTDLLLAAVVLLGFWWLMLVIAALIRIESKGPALFRQQRIGKNGVTFTCYKFRTMAVDTPQVATHEVSSDRTTRIGKWLRVWKLDEFPQIFNVLMNRMSWVGPRPCLPVQTELIEERRKRGVLEVKPGITGLAQIRGIDMSDPVKLAQADEQAVFLRSIPFYFRILAQTFVGKGMGDRIR